MRCCWKMVRHMILRHFKFNRVNCRLYAVFLLFTCLLVVRFFRYSTRYFITPVVLEERLKSIDVLRVFDQIARTQNLTYFIWGGSLLGSFRHHGFVPWDDDVDVLMNVSQKEKIRTHLSGYNEQYKLYVHPFAWKFFDKDATYIDGKDFRWPYVDIFFFTEDDTHVWAMEPTMTAESYLPKDKVFPLTRRRFETLYLPAPCDPDHALAHFNIDRCVNERYSHKYEYWKPIYTWASVPCRELADRYSFVKHKKLINGWNETLEFGKKVLQYEIVSDYC